MRLRRVPEREGLVRADPDRPRAHHLEQVPGHREQVLAAGGVGHQGGPLEIERPLRPEHADLERRDRPGSLPEAHHHAGRAQAIEGVGERVPAHGVVDGGDPGSVRQLADPLHHVLAGVHDGVVAPVGARELRLLVAPHRADDGGPEVLRPLAGDEPHPAGRGVEEDGVAGLDRVAALEEVLDGHALEHHGRRRLVAHRFRDPHQPVGGDGPLLGVGSERARVGHPVADREVGDPFAEREDLSRALHPGGERKGRRRIEPHPEVDIDVVEPDRGVADAGLARTRRADRDLLEAHDVGAAGLVYLDGVGHSRISFGCVDRVVGAWISGRGADSERRRGGAGMIALRPGRTQSAAARRTAGGRRCGRRGRPGIAFVRPVPLA